MSEKLTTSYQEDLVERLKDTGYALGYLNACLEDGDEGVFLLGLRHVAEAHGGIRGLSKKAKLNREHLFRMLSKHGNPRLSNLRSLVSTFGWKIALAEKNRPHLKKAA
ncbi:MAG: transcriptional regulator [Elusimicrobia bacterium]|nr:transcriptional regulator [Elusimicrobiota bacterium]MBI3013450.1 transcriptional regulator [Elusimicrobiota bacterium]